MKESTMFLVGICRYQRYKLLTNQVNSLDIVRNETIETISSVIFNVYTCFLFPIWLKTISHYFCRVFLVLTSYGSCEYSGFGVSYKK